MSLVELSALTLSLLSRSQRKEAIKNILLSILQASLEVLSVAAIIPVFLKLVDNTINIELPFLSFVGSFPWPVIIVGIVIVFVIKNLISLWIAQFQSKFIHDIFISFSQELYQRFYQQGWANFTHDNSAEIVRKIKHSPSDFTNYVLLTQLMLITDVVICFLIGLVLM